MYPEGVTPFPAEGRGCGGQIPRAFITDGLERCHVAFKKAFRALKSPCPHPRYPHRTLCNTNKPERADGELAGRFGYARDINK